MKLIGFMAIALAMILGSGSCHSNSNATQPDTADMAAAAVPQFSGDSALAFAKTQCDFGPRVPATEAHKQCAQWLTATMQRLCDSAWIQHGEATTFDGKHLQLSNIIGVVNPDAEQRILLMAHWDCRPWADNDPDPANHRKPVMGANDGASGVAVLLELARQMKAKRPNVGVDIVLVDAEDWGSSDDEDSWALGTQYWAAHPHYDDASKPMFGIVVDMVGASGAKFAREYFSMQYAQNFVEMVWSAAAEAGFGTYFTDGNGGGVTDDHIAVNKVAGIPCLDIIDMRTDSPTGFYDGWHTTHDTFDRLDAGTLHAVGQTLTAVIYSY